MVTKRDAAEGHSAREGETPQVQLPPRREKSSGKSRGAGCAASRWTPARSTVPEVSSLGKDTSLTYGRVVAEASNLLVGAPESDTVTDGVKLFCFMDALIFAPVQ